MTLCPFNSTVRQSSCCWPLRTRKKERKKRNQKKRERDSNDLSNAALELRHKFRPPSVASGRTPAVSFGQFPRYDFPSSPAVSSPLNRHRGVAVASRVDTCTRFVAPRHTELSRDRAPLRIFPRPKYAKHVEE